MTKKTKPAPIKLRPQRTYTFFQLTVWKDGQQTTDSWHYTGNEVREIFTPEQVTALLNGKMVTKADRSATSHWLSGETLAAAAFAKAVR